MISVLLPTRGRPEHLASSIASLRDFAKNPDEVEILLGLDNDDPHLGAALALGCRSIVGPRHGYRKLHLNWNALAAASTGSILVNWNDDAEMKTLDWDRLLLDGPAYSVQFMRRDILEAADMTFPATAWAVYEAMGHLSLNAYADNWLHDVAEAAEIAVYRNDIVFHHHRLDDQTARDIGHYGTEEFDALQPVRAEDARRVVEAKPKETACALV